MLKFEKELFLGIAEFSARRLDDQEALKALDYLAQRYGSGIESLTPRADEHVIRQELAGIAPGLAEMAWQFVAANEEGSSWIPG